MKIIGIDLGGTKVKIGVVDKEKLLEVIYQEIDNTDSMLGVIKQITNELDKVFDKTVSAIGIGVPSIVDPEKGIVFEVTNIPSWKKVPLKKILERKYHVPVLVNNDAKCFVLGEKYFGFGKIYKDIAGITLGTGVGGGIIVDGKLYAGQNCGAGDFCNILYKESNLEHYSSGMFYKQFGMEGKDISRKARAGDGKCLKILEEQGHHIGNLLGAVVNSVDPEIIILYGSTTKDYDLWKKSMTESLKENIYKRSFARLKIKVSKNKDIALLGAASLWQDYNKR